MGCKKKGTKIFLLSQKRREGVNVQLQDTCTCLGSGMFYFTGQNDSPPKLIETSDDGCEYTFEWQTAAACVRGTATGLECRVFDETLGQASCDV